MENEKIFNRENIYYGKVVLYNHKEDSLKKERSILFTFPDNTESLYDLLYETPNYFIVGTDDCRTAWALLKTRSRFEKDRFDGSAFERNNFDSIFIYYQTKLNVLLEYFGFPEEMTEQDCLDIYNNLFDGIFAYNHCELFGYQKKPKFEWKNGLFLLRENPSECSMSNYDFVEENKLTPYFEILNQIEYHTPEAYFQPFEEEGQIRKRVL